MRAGPYGPRRVSIPPTYARVEPYSGDSVVEGGRACRASWNDIPTRTMSAKVLQSSFSIIRAL